MSTTTWRIERMAGFRLSHPFVAVAPGCPNTPHPTRWCACAVFRTDDDARAYINEQEAK